MSLPTYAEISRKLGAELPVDHDRRATRAGIYDALVRHDLASPARQGVPKWLALYNAHRWAYSWMDTQLHLRPSPALLDDARAKVRAMIVNLQGPERDRVWKWTEEGR